MVPVATTARYLRSGWQLTNIHTIQLLPHSLFPSFHPSSFPFTPPPFSSPSSLSTAFLLPLQTCLVWEQLEEKISSFLWRIFSLSLHLNFLHPNISSPTTIYKYGCPKKGTEWRIQPQGDQFRPIMHLTDKPNLLGASTSFQWCKDAVTGYELQPDGTNCSQTHTYMKFSCLFINVRQMIWSSNLSKSVGSRQWHLLLAVWMCVDSRLFVYCADSYCKGVWGKWMSESIIPFLLHHSYRSHWDK